jgi:hypothetical protein
MFYRCLKINPIGSQQSLEFEVIAKNTALNRFINPKMKELLGERATYGQADFHQLAQLQRFFVKVGEDDNGKDVMFQMSSILKEF